MEFIENGAQANIYKKDDKVIKLFKKNISKQDIEAEMNLQKMAYDLDLPVPKIYDIIEIDGKFGILMEYINGLSLGRIIQNNPDDLEKYLCKSIEIQQYLNNKIVTKFPSMKEKLYKKIERVNIIHNDIKHKIFDLLNEINFSYNLCHGDFHFMNLLQTSDGIKIIDWVDSSSGIIEADIYRTYLLYFIHNEQLANLFIDKYCKITKTSKENILFWAPIIAAARLSEDVSDLENEKLMKIIYKNI
jgi:uncharacterized protein (TIGR02172 family)